MNAVNQVCVGAEEGSLFNYCPQNLAWALGDRPATPSLAMAVLAGASRVLGKLPDVSEAVGSKSVLIKEPELQSLGIRGLWKGQGGSGRELQKPLATPQGYAFVGVGGLVTVSMSAIYSITSHA